MRKLKAGDKIRYLGTKEGRINSDWNKYFGDYGIKKGSTGIISSYYNDHSIFIKGDGRPTRAGCLYECDIELIEDYKFGVGDIVKVSDEGQYYSSYEEKAKIMNLKDWKSGRPVLPKGSRGVIVGISGNYIVAIKSDSKDYIFNIDGIQLISPKNELIKTNMEHINIDEIKDFPLEVLAKAEKKAKEELAEEQADIAKNKFKELHKQIAIAESNVKQAKDILAELKGQAKITKASK